MRTTILHRLALFLPVLLVTIGPIPAHMSVEGIQGTIEGSSEIAGREGTIVIFEVHHLIHQPIDPTTGQVSARLVHEPLIVTKAVDKATPKLYQALASGERLQVKLDFYRIQSAGQEEKYYGVTLNNALLIAIEPFVPTTLDPLNQSFGHNAAAPHGL